MMIDQFQKLEQMILEMYPSATFQIDVDHLPSGVILVDIYEKVSQLWIVIEYSPRDKCFGFSVNEKDAEILLFDPHDMVVSNFEDVTSRVFKTLKQYLGEKAR